MAFDPYLSDRNLGCYRAFRNPPGPPALDPACTVDPYTQMFRDRWNILRTDPCQRRSNTQLDEPCESLGADRKAPEELCVPPIWDKSVSLYKKDFKYPRSHNAIDDCCKAPCPCPDKFPELPGNVSYYCKGKETCPPLDDCTTYRHFYVPHEVCPRERRPPRVYDPCDCPMENCSITRTDYCKKEPIPGGQALAQVIEKGVWSAEQFCKEFTDETTTGAEYGKKCAERRVPFKAFTNLCIPNCPSDCCTETREQFQPKGGENPCYPQWISNDTWYKPATPLEKCTTYNHFYQPYPIEPPMCTNKVGTPGAIPFCTLHKLCYSGIDPVTNQVTPVEVSDNDPWPYVKPCPIRYQDNLQTDPCAPFIDDTTQKCDYTPKALCRPNENFAPLPEYIPPLFPFNDNTTMKTSYPAYNWCQYKEAFGNAGNPCGIDWGPYCCPPLTDKCLPRFPAPYGNPLKPCLIPRCPCGPFDNRSTYNTDFQFRSAKILEDLEEDMCRQPNVPKGYSLSRFDFVAPKGKKAEIMPPPKNLAYRCIHPCSIRETDTIYRLEYHDFWKSMSRKKLELYRGKPVVKTRRDKGTCQEPEEEQEIIYQPVYIRTKKSCSPIIRDPPGETVDFQSPEFQRCREIPYSGHNILNRPLCTETCNGYR